MNAKDLYIYTTDQATAVVVQVQPSQLHRPTPDAEADVQELVQHMLHDLDQAAAAAGDKRAHHGAGTDAGADADALAAWQDHAVRAERAVGHSRETVTVQLPDHSEHLSDYLWAAANHQLMHAWDLGQAIGVSVVFDEVVAQALHDRAMALRRHQRAAGKPYGPLIPVPAGANTQTKLLATMGRSENWLEAK